MLNKPISIKPLPWQPLFESRFNNFHINLLQVYFISSFSMQMINLSRLDTFSIFLINIVLILSNF